MDPIKPIRDVFAAAQAVYDNLDEVWSAIKALVRAHGYDIEALLEVPAEASGPAERRAL